MAYTIKSGDTLSGIASKQGTTVANLLSYNPNITDANKIQAGASLNLIAPSALAPANAAVIPTPPISTVNPASVTGTNAQIAANTQALTQAQLDAQNAASGQTQQTAPTNDLTSLFNKYLGSMSAPAATPMPVQADQSALNAAKQAQIDAQARLAGVNTRITGLTAEAEAAKLAQENTFGTTGNTVGQQAQIDRNYAIKALPMQIEALTAQAQVAQAQGNTALAQDVLQQAQQHLDTVYKVQQQDAQNAYDYKTKIATAVYNFASEQQKAKLDALAQKATFDHQDAMATLANERDITKLKLENSLKNSGATTVMQTPGVGTQTLTGKPQTQAQVVAAGYAQRASEADKIISGFGDKFTGLQSYAGQSLPNFLKSSERQQYEQAKRNFVNAVLRPESGAVISEQEFKNADKQYFPQPGDGQAVIAQKATNRQTKISSLYSAGNVAQQATPGSVIEDADGKRYIVGADGETLTAI